MTRNYSQTAGAVRYQWRDPRYVTPRQQIDFAERDRRLAMLQAEAASEESHRAGDRARKALAEFPDRYERFCELRARGMRVPYASDEVGVTAKTGWRYEKKRKAATP